VPPIKLLTAPFFLVGLYPYKAQNKAQNKTQNKAQKLQSLIVIARIASVQIAMRLSKASLVPFFYMNKQFA